MEDQQQEHHRSQQRVVVGGLQARETEDKSIFIVPLSDPILSQINGVNISARVVCSLTLSFSVSLSNVGRRGLTAPLGPDSLSVLLSVFLSV